MKNTKQNPRFDDFLDIGKENFNGTGLIVFSGISGSGKSSYLQFLERGHAAFQNLKKKWIWTMHGSINLGEESVKSLLFIDEIVSPWQLISLALNGRRVGCLAIASHISPLWYHLAFPLRKKRFFRTDRGVHKLERLLDRKKVTYSSKALETFYQKYGGSFVDLACVLERSPKRDLDQALIMHQRMDSLKIEQCKDWHPKIPRFEFADKSL